MPRKPALSAWYTSSAVLCFFHAVPYTSFGTVVARGFLSFNGVERADCAINPNTLIAGLTLGGTIEKKKLPANLCVRSLCGWIGLWSSQIGYDIEHPDNRVKYPNPCHYIYVNDDILSYLSIH